jgi:predicted dehydrogenase
VRRIRWETLRNQPAVAAGEAGNWRTDPAQSGGGVLVDHGWHAFYVVRSWLSGPPSTIEARLERRKHQDWPLEDTAEIALAAPDASASIFLTWAAPERGNRAEIEGESGRISLDGGRVTLETGAGAPKSWDLPSLTEGSHHPDWFGGVAAEFFHEIDEPASRGGNLAEAAFCARAIALARQSSEAGGAVLPFEESILEDPALAKERPRAARGTSRSCRRPTRPRRRPRPSSSVCR